MRALAYGPDHGDLARVDYQRQYSAEQELGTPRGGPCVARLPRHLRAHPHVVYKVQLKLRSVDGCCQRCAWSTFTRKRSHRPIVRGIEHLLQFVVHNGYKSIHSICAGLPTPAQERDASQSHDPLRLVHGQK